MTIDNLINNLKQIGYYISIIDEDLWYINWDNTKFKSFDLDDRNYLSFFICKAIRNDNNKIAFHYYGLFAKVSKMYYQNDIDKFYIDIINEINHNIKDDDKASMRANKINYLLQFNQNS
jgi:hypothetical protein